LPHKSSTSRLDPTDEAPKYRQHALSLFLVALVLNAVLVGYNFRQGFLPGHEFRQTQTALSIAFIEQDHDYSLAYPTPLLGPPWSIPMEFPLYQWAAAGIMQTTGWSLPVSARAVSMVCFYLSLPALLWLLRDFGFGASARWSILSLVLCTPIYIFYTRAILIESMALMFVLWFVLAFSRMCRHRSWRWVAVAAITATGASLVKVTTMMAWCIGPAIGGLWWSWRMWRQAGWTAFRNSVLMGLSCALPPGIATIWWVRTADAIKETSPSGERLISSNLTDFNFGKLSDHFDISKWGETLNNISSGIAPIWIIGLAGILGVLAWCHSRNWRGLVALGWFGAVVFAFPVLYRIHDYYFYAIAVFIAVSVATGIEYVVRRFHLPWARTWLILLVALTQLHAYKRTYFTGQALVSSGGSQLHRLIRDATPVDEVVIVLGEDWSASTAYYARRRCFMIREEMMHFPEECLKQIESLDSEKVSALIASGDRRESTYMIGEITRRFGLDAKPSVANGNSDVYLSTYLRREFLGHLALHPNYGDTVSVDRSMPPIPAITDKIIADLEIHPVTPNQAAARFGNFSPPPFQYRTQFGFSPEFIDGKFATGAHPDSGLWVTVPPPSTRVDLSFGLREEAYVNPPAATDGVQFIVIAISANGTETVIFDRLIDPVSTAADRGTIFQTVKLPTPTPASLKFSARPGPHANYAYDWAYWGDVDIH
jgi:hypothetical protein